MIFLWRKSATAEWLAMHGDALGSFSAIERPPRRRLTVEVVCENRTAAKKMRAQFGGAIQTISDTDFRAFLRPKNSKPIRIGRRLVVTDSRIRNSRAANQLVIPAGAAFGTGAHATTAMSLRFLEEETRGLTNNWRMLDLGTGSGILALAAARFGANEIVAIDLDPLALATARENAKQNGIASVEFIEADVGALKVAGKFQIVAANLFSELLIATLPKLRAKLADNARLILSGIMRAQEREVRRALSANRFGALEIRRRGKWIAILAGEKRS